MRRRNPMRIRHRPSGDTDKRRQKWAGLQERYYKPPNDMLSVPDAIAILARIERAGTVVPDDVPSLKVARLALVAQGADLAEIEGRFPLVLRLWEE